MSSQPLIYLILGARGSGRREVLADLLEGGLAPEDRALTLLAETEPASSFDSKLGTVGRWKIEGEIIATPDLTAATHVFIVLDGAGNPVDQIEAISKWLPVSNCEFARAFCVVNCQFAEKHPALLAWYDACIHFSDVVFLNRRTGVANKWMSDFKSRYASLFYPCLFEMVKDGRVKNPALCLEPEARRMSHALDLEQDWIIEGDDADTEANLEEGTEEITAAVEEDPYFKRHLGGHRDKVIPDIADYLAGP